jgi:UPF0755 protein
LAKNKKRNFFFSFLKFISVLVALCIVLIPVSLGLFIHFNSPPQAQNRENSSQMFFPEIDGIRLAANGGHYIEVRRGESSQSVGLRLERAGLIKNRYFWNFLCRLENEHVKTGIYRFDEPLSQLAILRLLVSGRQVLYRVTIPEGVTLKRTARILEDEGICSAEDFLAAARNPAIISYYRIPNTSMEGYLFPDTYLFPKNFPAEQVVRTMADNFFSKLYSISPSLQNKNPQELNNIIIMASIVEREYRVREEAPIMAGVFYNRLRINMALQSCATVEYVITEILDRPHPSVIFNVDLEIRSPYNTYMNRGLPPGPISAPGVVALRAAIYPENTNYLYFRLTDPTSGRHHFSRTYDEHVRAGQLLTRPAWR